MKVVRIFLLLVTLLVASVVHSTEPLLVTIRPSAEVQGISLTLGDVSTLAGGQMVERQRLAGLVLGRSPRVGYTGRYSLDVIKSRVVQQLPGIGDRLRWQGETVVSVKALGKLHPAASYVKGAKDFLTAKLADQYDEVKVETHGIYRDLLIPNGQLDVRYRMNELQRTGKRMAVWTDVLVDGQRIQTIPVWFNLKCYGYGYALKQDVAADTPFTGKLLEWRYQDLSGVSGTLLKQLPVKQKVRFRKSKKSGDVIVAEDLERAPDVSRGTQVQILATSGEAEISVQATALQDGVLGQLIRVQHGSTGVKYQARVIGPNLLSVDGV